ncbi:MAG: hypothetical protein RJB66_2496 [Pseudomonadota bacterium]|jgi:thimet oligopeptidase
MLKNLILFICMGLLISSCAHKPKTSTADAHRVLPNPETEALIRYDYKKGELEKLCQLTIKNFKGDLEAWHSSFKKRATEPQALTQFEELLANFNDALAPLTFMGSVSMVASLRDESSACEEKASVTFNEVFTNRATYEILKQVQTSNSDEARLLKETKFAFEMNGMSLKDDDLKKFKVLKDRLSQLSVRFGQNLNNDTSTVTFTEKELQGVKADFLARLKKDSNGHFIVTTKSPDYIHVMENASVSETRKKMVFAYNNRQAEANTPLLQEATKIRSEMAQLMGYSTYADYALREKMAENSQAVFDFLNGLKGRLSAKNKSDIKAMATFKKNTMKDNSPFAIWDIPFVANKMKILKYRLDEDMIREYFPAQSVVDQTLAIYSQVLGVNFKAIEKAPVWAPNVQLYEVKDKASGQVVAYFYSDLIPREGKYGHAAAFPLLSGRVLDHENGRYQTPIAAIVANFTPAAPGKPVLLSHDEVETFFHEFGHIMHQVLTKAKFASLSGTNVKGDFVEAPSQMLENWIWQKDILVKMSQHYQNPKKKIPSDMIDRLQKLRLFNSGVQYTRQLVFGVFDMNIHTNPNIDVTEEYAKVHLELTGLPVLEGTHFPASFGHMMGGYSAGYYGYLWSKVFAEDMFSVFLRKGILDPKTGMRYRTEILEPGNMRDPMELIRSFLGRSPNNRAFFRSLGV